ncbi:TPA: MFS transporter, partial [Klebsiella oxytoca]
MRSCSPARDVTRRCGRRKWPRASGVMQRLTHLRSDSMSDVQSQVKPLTTGRVIFAIAGIYVTQSLVSALSM